MDYLWSPWRYQSVANIHKNDHCVFCDEEVPSNDSDRLILFRGEYHFIILNRFPYTCGHLLVAPYQHIADIASLSSDQSLEMMTLIQRVTSALKQVYNPDGFNLGMNLGKCAGAGIDKHVHFHIVPRWCGDSNFVSVTGETRVLPETLETTYSKLKPFFEK